MLLLMLDDEHGVAAGAATLQQTPAGVVLAELPPLSRIRPEGDRHGEDAGPRITAIIALISASGTLPSLTPAPTRSDPVATRGKEFEQGDRDAAAVGVAASGTAAGTAVVVTTVTT